MSSATSIDRVNAGRVKDADAAARKHGRAQSADTFHPWHFFVLASLVAATIAVVMAREARPEHLVLISLTIGAAGFAAGALYRTLAPFVRNDVEGRADTRLTEGMHAVLEREKMLVLRSIKELEFDRAMGKVSPKDFDEMAGRLRARALSLMRQLDTAGDGYRELIERELEARMRRSVPARQPDRRRGQQVEVHACQCGTVNDADATFCKRCGTKLSTQP
jgi:hypothetical protein